MRATNARAALMQGLKFDAAGLIPAIAQDRATGEIRMMAWMNEEALAKTLETGLATFYSRSRQKLWVKGETSNHRLRVESVVADCDGDTLLLLVEPEGASCHTGRPNCFFRPLRPEGPTESESEALPYLFELESVIQRRQASSADKSYTRSLLDGGAAKVGAKIGEEARELVAAVHDESDDRVASEAADVLFHVLVALRLRGVALKDVVRELVRRSSQSGHAEKAARKPPVV
jgi:phosphoribosyl-ATP pyrophosphohydrolase/phosphoribosyl-AMP cyclohydrolase